MLCEVISPVMNALVPEYLEILLSNLIFQPPKTHIPCFGFFVTHFLMDKGIGRLVVSLEGSWRLRMTHLLEEIPDG